MINCILLEYTLSRNVNPDHICSIFRIHWIKERKCFYGMSTCLSLSFLSDVLLILRNHDNQEPIELLFYPYYGMTNEPKWWDITYLNYMWDCIFQSDALTHTSLRYCLLPNQSSATVSSKPFNLTYLKYVSWIALKTTTISTRKN